ncbi:MAG: putative integral rane export protein [Acidimicrobiales bacterium]|jgi:RND superfamily putative drug exporter|nr:putative integral rane export protein [Acidimicrobiales bacterium]
MFIAGLARWCYRRRRAVVVSWIVGFIVLNALGGAIGSAYTDNFSGGHSDSIAAFDLLKTRFPARAGDTADIVFTSTKGVNDPGARTALESLFAEVGPGKLPHVVAIDSPYTGVGRVSHDGSIAYATVTFDKQAGDLPAKTAKPLIDAAKKVKVPGLTIELSGPLVARALQPPMGATEGIGLLAAIVILFIAFGSLLAMSLPVLAAIFGVGIGLVLVTLLSHLLTVPSFAPYVAIMIGLGVGIDYALFIVVRYRSGLHDGLDPESANVLALTTAGRAVLFAGCTVIISLLGMFMMGINFIYGLSIGAVLAVLMTMLASVTLVPAIMGFAGTKLAAKEHKRRHHRESAAFRWSRQIQKRPWIMAGVSLVVLVTIAIPMFSIRLGVADQGNDPTSLTTRRAYDLLAKGFGPGFNGPVLLAADFTGTTNTQTVTAFAETLRRDPDIAYVAPVNVNPGGNAAIIPVIARGAPQDRSTEQLVHRLRSEIKAQGLVMHVGSETAIAIDASDHVGARLPYMVAAVIVLSFLLLLTVFRSVLVAVKAGIMNLLSIGAAYGVIVAIFQWGWLRNVVGIGRPGPIEFWVPMMLFTVLFGLSMDYEVFLLSRVREEYLLSGDNATAVADGLAATARVITAAAAIMIAVFMSFVLGDLRVLKLLGLGLATAIFIDATVVRMVLVPATMELLGKANWWLPGWLDRMLPRISIEAPPALATAAVSAPGGEPERVAVT